MGEGALFLDRGQGSKKEHLGRLGIQSRRPTDSKPTGRPESLAPTLNPKGETREEIDTAVGP